MKGLLIIAIALLLVGFGPCSRNVKRVPAQCNQICFLPCTTADGDVGVRWEADPTDPAAFDALGNQVIPALTGKLLQCEVRRKACAQCLQRLDHEKVIEL